MSKKVNINNEELVELYKNGENLREICEYYGLSPNTRSHISKKLKSLGVEIRQDKGDNHHAWKGGKIIKGDGYYGIWNPTHQRADKQGYVYEHTLVIEEKIGRLPNKDEVVHHINLDKLDNSPENLWLCGNKEHLICHRSIEKLIKPLLEKGIIEFDNGEYKIKFEGGCYEEHTNAYNNNAHAYTCADSVRQD